MAPYNINNRYNIKLLEFRDWLIEQNDGEALTPLLLSSEFEAELIDYFFDIMEALFNNPFPTLYNTDNELFQFTKSYFKLTITLEEVIKKLLPLTLSKDLSQITEDAEYDKSGLIKKATIRWLKKGNKKHKDWDSTVMGHIMLKKGQLILETNSEKRLKKAQKLFTKYLGDNIKLQRTLIETPEQKIKEAKEKGYTNNKPAEFANIPEAQEQLKEMAKVHWQAWFDTPIPALNNQTPREAALTEAGRERLEALFLQYEYNDNYAKSNTIEMNIFKADINYLKKELQME